MNVAPFLCEPIYQPWVWGGRNLGRVLKREIPPEGPVAESWEVSDVEGFETNVADGPFAGRSLRQVIEEHPQAMLGSRADRGSRFPLLVKYLDAESPLSVQVHPGDAYAGEHEGGSPGKTEMWVVLEAKPGSQVIAGLQPGVGLGEVRAALENGTVPEIVRRRDVKGGDVILVPAGRVHALGAGIVALEVQQTSNVTYRLYDWGRFGADGKPRTLHSKQALEVIDFHDDADPHIVPVVRNEVWGKRSLLAVTPHFLAESWDTTTVWDTMQPISTETTGHSPDVLMLVKGRVRLRCGGGVLEVPHGGTVLVPAEVGDYSIEQILPSLAVRARMPDLEAGLGDWEPANDGERRLIRAVCDRAARERLFPHRADG